MNDYVLIFSAAGVFVGNFIYHSWKGDPTKGAIIGLIAAVLVLVFFGIRHAITG
jgi:hypothetical protein